MLPVNEIAFKQLLRVLREVKSQGLSFDMSMWIDSASCGTVACAIGWATQDPWFKAQGFYMNNNRAPCYGEACSFSAVAKFFKIPLGHARMLFGANFYETGRSFILNDRLELTDFSEIAAPEREKLDKHLIINMVIRRISAYLEDPSDIKRKIEMGEV